MSCTGPVLLFEHVVMRCMVDIIKDPEEIVIIKLGVYLKKGTWGHPHAPNIRTRTAILLQ